MTSKKLIGAGLAGLAALAVAALLIDPSLAQTAAPAAAPAAAAAGGSRHQQGRQRLDDDVDRSRPADDHPGPRVVLRRPGASEERAVGAHPRFLHGVRRHRDLGGLRLQPRLHRRLHHHRRPRQAVLEGRHGRLAGGDLLGRRADRRVRLHLLPDDLRRDHAGPHRRRLRRTHEVLGGGDFHPAVGDAGLLPDRAHGLVLGRPGRDRRRREGSCCRRRRRCQEGRPGQA